MYCVEVASGCSQGGGDKHVQTATVEVGGDGEYDLRAVCLVRAIAEVVV